MGSQVEIKAVEFVMEYERKQGRNPRLVKNVGYDIESSGLKIEVKGRGMDKKPFVLLNENNIQAVERENKEDYKLYVVMNPLNNPRLIIFSKEDVLNLRKSKRQWQIPLRKKDYDSSIAL